MDEFAKQNEVQSYPNLVEYLASNGILRAKKSAEAIVLRKQEGLKDKSFEIYMVSIWSVERRKPRKRTYCGK